MWVHSITSFWFLVSVRTWQDLHRACCLRTFTEASPWSISFKLRCKLQALLTNGGKGFPNVDILPVVPSFQQMDQLYSFPAKLIDREASVTHNRTTECFLHQPSVTVKNREKSLKWRGKKQHTTQNHWLLNPLLHRWNKQFVSSCCLFVVHPCAAHQPSPGRSSSQAPGVTCTRHAPVTGGAWRVDAPSTTFFHANPGAGAWDRCLAHKKGTNRRGEASLKK